jgi:hypothetical protein
MEALDAQSVATNCMGNNFPGPMQWIAVGVWVSRTAFHFFLQRNAFSGRVNAGQTLISKLLSLRHIMT